MEETCCWDHCRKPAVILRLCLAHTQVIITEYERWSSPPSGAKATPAPPKPALKKHTVYYIKTDGLIKIGYSGRVGYRVRDYSPRSEILAFEPGDRAVEKARHQQFRDHLVSGNEYFEDCPAIREHIATVIATHGPPWAPNLPKRRTRHPVTVTRVEDA